MNPSEPNRTSKQEYSVSTEITCLVYYLQLTYILHCATDHVHVYLLAPIQGLRVGLLPSLGVAYQDCAQLLRIANSPPSQKPCIKTSHSAC